MSTITPNELPRIRNGMALGIGDKAWMYANECPIIIAAAGSRMVVGCGDKRAIPDIIAALLEQKTVTVYDVTIVAQYVPFNRDVDYVEQARSAGVRNVWCTSIHTLPDFSTIIMVERVD